MKILLLVSSMHGGGAERVAATLASAWAMRGDRVTLMPTYSARGECAYALSPQVETVWLADLVEQSGQRASLWNRGRRLRRFVQEHQPDVIVSFLTNVNVVALMATWGLKVPVIVCERTNPAFATNLERRLRWLRRWLYPRADVVTVQTPDSIPIFHKMVPGMRQLHAIPNPLPEGIPVRRPGVAEHGTPGRRRLVAMGRFAPVKQFDLLIRVFARLAAEYPDWDLYLWGEGPQRRALEDQIARDDLMGRVMLPGRTRQPWHELAAADAFVLTSAVEGFPNALMEAMAAGLPAVSFDCPSGPADLTDHGQDGLLVPPQDEEALYAALHRLMGDAELRARLGAQAMRAVRTRYALPVVLAQWDRLFTLAGVPAGLQSVGAAMTASTRMPGVTPAVIQAQRPAGRVKILHIISGLGQGGAEAVLFRLTTSPGMDASVQQEVLSMTDEGVYGERMREAGIRVHTLGMQPGRMGWRDFQALRRRIEFIGPDVVQTWMYHANLAGGLAARLCGIRAVVWGIRNAGSSLSLISRSARLALRLGARLSGLLPAVTVSCAEDAAQRHIALGYRRDRMEVIANGYDLSRFSPDPEAGLAQRRRWGVDGSMTLLACVARWDPLKDHANLIRALAKARGAAQRPFRCALVGRGMTPDNAELMALIRAEGMDDWILPLGPTDDVAAVMNAADIHVLSSRAEGFPNVVAEAMACGTPCVVTDVGDAALIVGDTGWVATPESADALADAIRQALVVARDPLELRARATAARTRVQSRFGLHVMQEAYARLWQNLPMRRRARTGRLLMVVNNPAFFLSHRLPVAQGAQAAGYEVHVATMAGPAVAQIRQLGFVHHAIPMSRSGRRPWEELGTIWALYRLMRRLRPDVVHLVTIKPVLYGGVVARWLKVPRVVAAVSGLGFVFVDDGRATRRLRKLVTTLYRLALRQPRVRVIFQNAADRDVLLEQGVILQEQARLIRGSGVDLAEYAVEDEPETPPLTVVMAARLLRDKGVQEYIEAAARVRDRIAGVRFVLAGASDPGNPASVDAATLAAWNAGGHVDYIGECNDVAALYARAHIVVLPSWREGLPRSLVEAAACGRAVVTTDVPGCRDAIEPGETGLLVPVRDAGALADGITQLVEDSALRHRLGRAGRALAEREFDIGSVVQAHLDIYAE